MSNVQVDAKNERSQYVDFWNTVLVPKFVRWRHILVGGLTLHSAKIFPTLAVRPGEKVVESSDPPWGRAQRLVTDLDPSEEHDIPSPCHNALALDAKTPRWPDGGAVLADAWTWLLAGRA